MKKHIFVILSCLLFLICFVTKCSQGSMLKPQYISCSDTSKHLPITVKSTLKKYNMYSEGMYKLLLGTAATESEFGKFNKQIGGPALGVFQMEPRTAQDIWTEYLEYHPFLRAKVKSTLWKNVNRKTQLRYNLEYQTLMAVVHYKRAEERHNIKIEEDASRWSCSWYYKRYYNTHKGKGSTIRFFRKYGEYVDI